MKGRHEMKLYSFFRSSAAYRVRIALNFKGLGYEYVAKHFRKNGGEHRKPDYLAVNPQGLIPTLDDAGVVVPQSLAIIEYLEEAYPDTPRLLPQQPAERAAVRAMSQLIACDIHPLNNLRVLNYLKGELGQSEDTTNVWYRHWIAEGFAALEQSIAKHTRDSRHCFGGEVTIADVCLVPQVYNARRFQADLTPYPRIGAISAHLESLAPFATARPEAQPDSE
jgi:maleylacetoacetate isomerase/maleylpyruvate isomerase